MKTLERQLKQPPPLLKKPAVFRLLVTALLAEIGYAVLNISTMPVYLRDDRKFGAGVVATVLVAYLLSEAIFKSPMGHFADKHGRRFFMTLGPAISVATSLLSIAVPHQASDAVQVLLFMILRVFDGLGAAMLWPAAFAAMGDSVEDNERQAAMSLLNLCYLLGIALALPIGGVVNDLSHTKWGSLLLSATLFAGVAYSAWRIGGETAPRAGHTESTDIGAKQFLTSLKQIPEFMLLAVVTFCGIGFPMPIIKLFAQDQFSMSESSFGGLVFLPAIAMAVLSVPMAKYGERIGRAKAVHVGLGLCSLGMCGIAAGAVLPPIRTPLAFALAGVPIGVGFLLTIPAWMASVSDIDPRSRAANLGAVMTGQGIGAIIGASFGGLLYEKLQPLGVNLGLGPDFGRYSPFVGCAIFLIIGWLLSLKILHPPGAPSEP